jgi:hypothetical protein
MVRRRMRIRVDRMVTIAAWVKSSALCILDNNFIDGDLRMARDEFISRWKGMGGGWAGVLLAPPHAQPPNN